MLIVSYRLVGGVSVYDSQNAFAKECFVDQVASKLDKDPGFYRPELLKNSPRHKRVLQEVLLMSDWDKPVDKGTGRGCGVHKSFNSYVAMSCEVSLRDNSPVIEKINVAVDCGLVKFTPVLLRLKFKVVLYLE